MNEEFLVSDYEWGDMVSITETWFKLGGKVFIHRTCNCQDGSVLDLGVEETLHINVLAFALKRWEKNR